MAGKRSALLSQLTAILPVLPCPLHPPGFALPEPGQLLSAGDMLRQGDSARRRKDRGQFMLFSRCFTAHGLEVGSVGTGSSACKATRGGQGWRSSSGCRVPLSWVTACGPAWLLCPSSREGCRDGALGRWVLVLILSTK